MSMIRRLSHCVAVIVVLCVVSTGASASPIFVDNFDGTELDLTQWDYWVVYLDPTQMRDGDHADNVIVSDGTLKLPLDLYNPTALMPGDSFYGTDITSHQAFDRGQGLQVRGRMRVVDSLANPLNRGIIHAMFLFENEADATWDEIDGPEILSNDIDNAQGGDDTLRRVWTNVFCDYPTNPDKAQTVPLPPGIEATDFVTYTVRWLSDRVEWYVDDMFGRPQLVRTENDCVPDEAMNLHFNIHVSGPGWPEAYDAGISPVDNEADNQTYFLEIDWIEVTVVPEPATSALSLLGLAAMGLMIGRRRINRCDI